MPLLSTVADWQDWRDEPSELPARRLAPPSRHAFTRGRRHRRRAATALSRSPRGRPFRRIVRAPRMCRQVLIRRETGAISLLGANASARPRGSRRLIRLAMRDVGWRSRGGF